MPQSLAVRAVLIDLDGTLLDTVLDLHAAANAMLDDLGRQEVAVEAIRSYVGRGIPNLVKRVLAGTMEAANDRSDHPSGSDRLAEACELLGLADDELVVNVQGDEPLVDPALIAAVATQLAQRPDCVMSTAAHAIEQVEDFLNPNVVKVVLDRRQVALYFSRAPIAWWRDGMSNGQPLSLPSPAPWRHIGVYGYRAGFLRRFPSLEPAPLELTESLEQLRTLWHGERIAVHLATHAAAPGVDTPTDLERVRALLRKS